MWDVTMLVLHVAFFAVAVLLWRRAPCWMQKLAVGMVAMGMFLAGASFSYALQGMADMRWPVFILGLVIEHLGVMLWLFRVFKDSVLCPPISSAVSRHS